MNRLRRLLDWADEISGGRSWRSDEDRLGAAHVRLCKDAAWRAGGTQAAPASRPYRCQVAGVSVEASLAASVPALRPNTVPADRPLPPG
ncbi:hypothetical protein GCM10023178_48610 [Actinomadura luteofluorescens]